MGFPVWHWALMASACLLDRDTLTLLQENGKKVRESSRLKAGETGENRGMLC